MAAVLKAVALVADEGFTLMDGLQFWKNNAIIVTKAMPKATSLNALIESLPGLLPL
jgi:hypothetical protein